MGKKIPSDTLNYLDFISLTAAEKGSRDLNVIIKVQNFTLPIMKRYEGDPNWQGIVKRLCSEYIEKTFQDPHEKELAYHSLTLMLLNATRERWKNMASELH